MRQWNRSTMIRVLSMQLERQVSLRHGREACYSLIAVSMRGFVSTSAQPLWESCGSLVAAGG